MHALVIEAVPVRTEKLRPVLTEVQVVVVLAHHHVGLVIQLGEHFRAVVELGLGAELGQVAAEHHEVRLRLQQVGLGDRADQTAVPVADESVAQDVLDVGVGYVREGEILGRVGKSELHHADRQGAGRSHCPRAFQKSASSPAIVSHSCLLYFSPAGVAASSANSGLVSASMKATRSSIWSSSRLSGRMPPLRKSLTGSPSLVTPPLL